MKFIVFVLIIGALVAGLSSLEGFVIQHLWGWFLVRQFHLPPIGLAEAIGIGLIGTALSSYTYVKTTKEDALEALGVMFLRPVLFFVLGYVVSTFI